MDIWYLTSDGILGDMGVFIMFLVHDIQGIRSSTARQEGVHHPWGAAWILLSFHSGGGSGLLLTKMARRLRRELPLHLLGHFKYQ